MSKSLAEIFALAPAEEIGYVFDAPIHYIVLNRKDNSWTLDRVNRYLAILD